MGHPVPGHESGEDAVDESREGEEVRRPASRHEPPEGLPPGVYHARRVSSASGRAYDVATAVPNASGASGENYIRVRNAAYMC